MNNVTLQHCDTIFAADGILAQTIAGFKTRAAQIALANAVANAISQKRHLIAEAGTGTGKTYAYLVPAFLSDVKVIVTTGTKNLQDQLFHRDLPLIKKALGSSLNIAQLKGRANYLCHYRINLHAEEGRFLTADILKDFQTIHDNVARSDSGDIAEFSMISETSEVWSYVTSTTDNCLGGECPHYEECFLVKARKKAQQADVLVINHHLYFADLLLKGDGFGEILPGAQLFIFDEAHQLPEIATQFFGDRLSSRQLIELSKDCRSETVLAAKDMQSIIDQALLLENKVAAMRLALGEKAQRQPWFTVASNEDVQKAKEELQQSLSELIQFLTIARVRSKGLDACYSRATELLELLKRTTLTAPNQNQVLWFETFNQAFSLHCSPLLVAEDFSKSLKDDAQYIFTSATLAVDKKFDHFATSLGLKDYDTLLMQSPFSYRTQALLYLPRGIPDSSHPDYIKAVIDSAVPLINHLGGKTFLLFTSHKALQQAAELLKNTLEFPLLIQGTHAKNALLNQFRQLKNAVLLGTSSFWEGVDVKGAALSCVIIDKLPFESPSDPIVSARIQHLRQQQQQDPFYHYQLPKAVIALKQGVGRLIRDETDQGILMIADPRLGTRAYGAQFFASLPLIPKTRSLENVLNFISKMHTCDET